MTKLKTIIIALAVLTITACSQFGMRKLPNGWYRIDDAENNIVRNKPIVTADKFTDLRLDSGIIANNEKIYMIAGKVDNPEEFAKATEKSIGNLIGFLYDGKIICAPKINAQIDSGNFMITFPEGTSRADAEKVFNDLR